MGSQSRTPSPGAAQGQKAAATLKKKGPKRRKRTGTLQRGDFFMLGFGSMVGVGWAVSSNGWIAQAGGPIPAFIGFLLGTLLLIPIGLAHAELMSTLPVSGGVMAYGYRAFGPVVAFLGSWFVALAYLTILPWEAIYINKILVSLFPALHAGGPIFKVAGSPIFIPDIILGALFALGLFVINIKGSKLAGHLQQILSWIIIAAGALVIILSFAKGSFENLFPLYKQVGVGDHSSPLTGMLAVLVIVPFFMAGFDTIPQSIEERAPGVKYKTLAFTLVFSIIVAGVFYALIILSTSMVGPWEPYSLAKPPAMAPLLESVYPGWIGDAVYWLIMVGTLAGLFSTWNGMFMASSRLLQSMGRVGLIPKFFAYNHPKFKTPLKASIFCLIAAAIGPMVGPGVIGSLTSLGSFAFVLGWFVTCISAARLRTTEPDLKRPFKAPGIRPNLLIATPISAGILLLSFIPGQPAFMGWLSVVLFVVWTIIGLLFFWITNGQNRGIDESLRERILFGGVVPLINQEDQDDEMNKPVSMPKHQF